MLDWAADRNVDDYAPGRRIRGEAMTLVSGTALSDDGLLRTEPQLPDQRWSDLHSALMPCPGTPYLITTSAQASPDVHDHLGAELDPTIFDTFFWSTAHTDLQLGEPHRPSLTKRVPRKASTGATYPATAA
ncbi:hypothetical protein ABT256_20280 [Amycolatopsis japonica]|uniref:hypothetical protein n=1 Tax=Amycolatopsis japonica TaxID=208439 RepID=UPI00331956BE